jgi:hypothetical protein
VAVAGGVNETHLIERSQIRLLPEGAWAPYHAAEGLKPAAARESVKRSVAAAHRLAANGIRDAARRMARSGHELCGCAVLVGTGLPNWSTDQILAVHVRMHKAEGELFRDALVAGARACQLALATLPDKSALDAAQKILGLTRARLNAQLAALGKSAGPPWGKDQKEAAAAALVALKNAKRGGETRGVAAPQESPSAAVGIDRRKT